MSSGLQPAQAVSASKHALTISEILIYIFNEAKPAALVAAARVNRQWSEHALDRLWRNLESVVPLLEILALLARSTVQGRSVAEWNLPERIVSDRWQRLEFYAKRVYSISHDDSVPVKRYSTVVTRDAYVKIHYHYLYRGHFLPNLRGLSWVISPKSYVEAILSVLSPTVRELKLTFNGGAGTGLFLEELNGRTSSITSLSIVLKRDTPSNFNGSSGMLASIIASSPGLSSIALPQFTLTTAVVTALGSLRYLKHLQFSDDGAYIPQGDDSGCTFPLSGNTFQALEELACNHQLEDAALMLQTQIPPPALTSLFISTAIWSTTKTSFLSFLNAIALNLPGLKSLRLNLWEDTGILPEALDISNIELLSRLNLRRLAIGHNVPIKLDVKQLKWMASAWPCLEELWLTPDPVVADKTAPPRGSDISVLSYAAKHLPYLRLLGLYLDGNFHAFISNTDARFARLEVLDLGTSTITGPTPEEVAAALVDIMPEAGTKLITGPSIWHVQSPDEDDFAIWDTVRKLIPEYLRVQAGLRHRMALAERKFDREVEALEREVETLEKEVTTLTQQLKVVTMEAAQQKGNIAKNNVGEVKGVDLN